MEVIPGEPLLG